MKRLITILLLLFTFASVDAQRAGWWYGNAPGEAAAGPDTLTLTYWNDFILLHIQNTGITEDVNGVSEWQDRSGNGNHSTQTVNANKPSTDIDGNVVFDGNDWLDMSNIWASVNDSSYTLFAVFEKSSDITGQRIYGYADNSVVNNNTLLSDNVGADSLATYFFTVDQDGNIALRYLDTFLINDTRLVTVAASENTSIEVRSNGLELITDPVNGPWAFVGTNGYAIGSNQLNTVGYLYGKILFIGITNRKFSPAEIATTESELNSYFTIY